MNFRNPSYLFRLLLFSMLLGTIPVIIFGVSSYWKASTTIQKKVNESNRQVLHQSQLKVEYILKSVDQSMTAFITSTDAYDSLKQLRYTFNRDLFQKIYEGMVHLQTPNLGIQDVLFINLKEDWLIKNNGLYSIAEALDSSSLSQYTTNAQDSFWLKQRTVDKSNYDISLVKKLPIMSSTPTGILVTKISSYSLNQLILDGKGIGKLMILDADHTILANEDSALLGKPLKAFFDSKALEQTALSEGTFTVTENKAKHTIAFRKSDYNGWIYLSDVSIEDITKDSKSIGWFTFFMTMFIILMSFILSLQGSKRMYSPIRRLYSSFAPTAESKPRGGDEFAEMINRIGNLVSSQSQMKNELRSQLPQLKELFVVKLLQGDISSAEIEQKLLLLGYPSWKRMSVLTIQMDSIEDTRFHESDKDLLLFAINNIVSELLPEGQCLKPTLYNRSQVSVFGCDIEDEELFKKTIIKLADDIQDNIAKFLSLKVSIGISRSFQLLKDVSKAREQAEEALKYRIGLGEGAVLFIDEVQPNQKKQPRFPEELERKLIDAVKSFEVQRVEECLHEFMEELYNEKLTYREYEVFLVRLIIDFMREVDEASEIYQQLYDVQRALLSEPWKLKTAQELETWIEFTIVKPTMLHIELKTKSHYKKISDQILRVIHQEYDKDISLELCASLLNYHPDYLKKVFRKETGVNFSDYLSQYRMGIAKKWLIETEMKIGEIAEKLRYTNAQNFIRYFRKLEDKTPGQYREEHDKE